MSTDLIGSGDGRYVVPGNDFDLLAALPAPTPPVTVVVPYYRQQAQLDLLMAALSLQTYPAAQVQVVVADDGSPEPPTVPAGVTVVRQEDRGFRAAAARNLGALAAEGEVLCFLDADTLPEPGYLRAATRLPGLCGDAVVVGRRRHAALEGWSPARLRTWLAGGAAPVELTEPAWLVEAYARSADLLRVDDRSYRYVISAVLTIGAGLFAEVGGFDAGLVGYGGEDWELGHRVFTAGGVLAHEPRALAWHDGPDQAARGVDRAAKNAETLALAARIPDPRLRGGSLWPACPEVVVEIASGSPAAVLLSALSALEAGDVGVWVPAVLPATADPRIHHGPVPDAVAARARVRVRLDHPLLLSGLRDLIGRVRAGGPGRLSAPGLTVSASRAERRATRHGLPLERLFGSEQVPSLPAIEDPPDLARELDRLGSG